MLPERPVSVKNLRSLLGDQLGEQPLQTPEQRTRRNSAPSVAAISPRNTAAVSKTPRSREDSPARRELDARKEIEKRSKEAEQAALLQQKVMMAHAADIDLEAKRRQVRDIVIKLNDKSRQREVQLAARLEEIKTFILDEPKKGEVPETDNDREASAKKAAEALAKKVAKVATSILEMWRYAASTAIRVGNDPQPLQGIHNDAHNTRTSPDEEDTAKRFSRLFSLFQQYSGDNTPLPDTSKWTYEVCNKWANEIAPKISNEKMLRFIRSCSQSLTIGALPQLDVMRFAPNLAYSNVVPNKLDAALPKCGPTHHRHFRTDGKFELKLILPFEFKTEDRTPYAIVQTDYTIQFDPEMNPISLTSKALPAVELDVTNE